MQITDMRSFRLIYYSQKHILNSSPRLSLLNPKTPNYKFHSTPLKPIQFTNYLHNNEAPVTIEPPTSNSINTRVYNPITGNLESVSNDGDEKNPRVLSSQEYYEEAVSKDSDVSRVYGRRSGSQSWRSFGGGSKKKVKVKTNWVCESCGYSDGQWWGSCRSCNSVGSMKRFSEGAGAGEAVGGFEVSRDATRMWLPQQSGEVVPVRLMDVNRGINQMEWRIPL